MRISGLINKLDNIGLSTQFLSLRDITLKTDWNNTLKFNEVPDPAFTDCNVIQVFFSDIMLKIRPQTSGSGNEEIILSSTDLISLISQKFEKYTVFKSHIVALKPGGRQNSHKDGKFYHRFCRRLVIPIISNEKSFMYVNKVPHNLEPGIVYEMNNRLEHYSENLGNSVRVFMFIDIYDNKLRTMLDNYYSIAENKLK